MTSTIVSGDTTFENNAQTTNNHTLLATPVQIDNLEDISTLMKKKMQVHKDKSGNQQTLLVYDWDDTILPTTWLRETGLLLNSIAEMEAREVPSIPKVINDTLQAIEDVTLSLFAASEENDANCTLVIVTNSSADWVPFTAKRFLPRLLPLLQPQGKYAWYSARPNCVDPATYTPNMAVNWKSVIFRRLVDDCSTRFASCVSIGDGYSERCAVLALQDANTSAKAVRFAVQPSGQKVLHQLVLLRNCFHDLLHDFQSSGDVFLTDLNKGSYSILNQANASKNVMSSIRPTSSKEVPSSTTHTQAASQLTSLTEKLRRVIGSDMQEQIRHSENFSRINSARGSVVNFIALCSKKMASLSL